jgi:S-adenosylmethionine:tRNA ribosyltransferase-isomerase
VRVSDFDFHLPTELIAQQPQQPRDHSRLLVVDRRRGCWEHHVFSELPDLLSPRDLLVRNNTRVVPARLVGQRDATGGRWEGLFLHERPDGGWEMLTKTRGSPTPGECVTVGKGLRLLLEAKCADGSWIVRPNREAQKNGDDTWTTLEEHGLVPLPPYIRGGQETLGDRVTYQTIYARRPGSVAAPTAGLHFTHDVLKRLADKGVECAELTLHVGPGTFRPIETEQLEDHLMQVERAELSVQTVDTIDARRRSGGRVVAVGTSSTRALETASASGDLRPFAGETSIFIRPGYSFRAVDALVTNFHLPRSSSLVLVSALAGVDLIRAAYEEAIRCGYRFLSYGDAMLIFS